MQNALVVFIVRPFEERDINQLIQTYKLAFADTPWNEYMKCSLCGVGYGIKEVETVEDSCKKCGDLLELVEFWSDEGIAKDIEFAMSQPDPIILVAELLGEQAGFTWGYRVPFGNFPFLRGKISTDASYVDELAVRWDMRSRGVGTLLGTRFLGTVAAQGMREVVLRTDERSAAPMALYRKMGFSAIPDLKSPRGKVYDPEFPNRIYLRKELGG